jgi:hypothetical protein
VLPRLVVPGDPTATADRIRSHATLFRLGFVADLAAATFWLLTAMVLFRLLQHVDRMAAGAMVTFAAVGSAVMTLNQLNQFMALRIATGRTGPDTLVQTFADMQHFGYAIDDILFGLWLLPLGYLVIRSGYFPRVIGVFQILACTAYLAATAVIFLLPGFGSAFTTFVTVPAATLGELTFLVWLILRGVRVPATG